MVPAVVGSRGFEPRSARSERAASAGCATSRRCTGPSGWTRTTTSRVKNPACCVDTTKGNWTDGANGGTRTRTSRLGRPAGTITPHSPWFGLGYQSLIPGPTTDRWRSPAQELLSVVKEPALANCLATAPGFEPGPTRFGGSDAAVTPRCRSSFTPRPFQRQTSP